MMMIKPVAILVISALVVGGALSDARAEDRPLFYKGIRPLGMGGAFTAVADDENALIYNPAGIPGRGGRGDFEIIFPPTLEASQNAFDLISPLQDVLDPTKNEAARVKQFTDFIGSNLGEQFHLKASLFPNLLFEQTGIGLLVQADVTSAVHNPLSSSAVAAEGEGDVALFFARAKPREIKNRPVTIGYTVKAVHRWVFNEGYTIQEIVEKKVKLEEDLKKGAGGALDIGLLHPLSGTIGSPYFKSLALQPTVGLALQNIVASRMGDAGKLPFQANLGVALRQKMNFGRVLLAADMMDMTFSVGDDDFGKRLHMGVEYQFPRMLALRAGLYQGYPSVGATLHLPIINLAYAYYVEELGAFAGQVPNARHVLKLSLF